MAEEEDNIRFKPSFFQNVAICKSKISDDNPTGTPGINLSQDDLQASNIEQNQSVTTRILNTDADNFFRMEHTTTVNSMVMPNPEGQPYILIPSDKMSELNLEVGDMVTYAAIADDKIPGIETGPIRDKVASATNSSGGPARERVAEGQQTAIADRGRVRKEMTSTGMSMAETGQTKLGSDLVKGLNLVEDDMIPVYIDGPKVDNPQWFTVKVQGSGDRIGVTKAMRKDLGLEPDPTKLKQMDPDDRPNLDLTVDLTRLESIED